MNACAACREQIDLRMDGMLDSALEAQLSNHLTLCAACRRYDVAQQVLSGDLSALSRVADAAAAQQSRKSRSAPNWMHAGKVAAALVFAVLCTWTFVRRPSIDPGIGPTPTPIREPRPPVQLAVSVEPIDNERRFAIPLETDNPRVHMVWLYDSDTPAGDPRARERAEFLMTKGAFMFTLQALTSILLSIAIAQNPPAPKKSQPAANRENPSAGIDALGMMVVPLKNAAAYDVAFTVEQLLTPKNGTGPNLEQGPDQKTLIVKNFDPAQKDAIISLIAMYDVTPPPEKDNSAKASKPERPQQSNPVSARDVRMFPLQYNTPDSVMETLLPLFRNSPMVTNPTTNSLIVTGSTQELAAIADLLTKLDKPADRAKNSTPGVRTVQLKHRATDDVSKKLMSLLGGMRDRDARVASDEGRGKLILRGSPDFLEFAGQVISELDVPAQMIQFEFAFFSADQNAAATGESDDGARIPADLEDVAKELQRFGRVKLLGRLACNAMEDHQFVLEGSLGEGLSAKVSGAIINAVTDGTIQLSVQGQVRLTRPGTGSNPSQAPPRSSAFEINTTVVTRRGDTIMIGSAPTGWAPGESAIMVLQAKQ